MRTKLVFLCWLLAQAAGYCAPRTIHVFVALCDNVHQGIVPVPAALGNGQDPANNLYWGAQYGMRTFFQRANDWERVPSKASEQPVVLDQVVFKHRSSGSTLVAHAYDGRHIKTALEDFYRASRGRADLIVFIGHNGLIDFSLPPPGNRPGNSGPATIVLACQSQKYFSKPLTSAGCTPLLFTTNFMAPEAYILHASLSPWLANEDPEKVREAAARAYAKYQRISEAAAQRLFVTR